MQLSHTSCIRLRNVPTYGETFSLFNSSAIIPAFSSPHSPYQHRKRFIRGWVQYTRKQRQMVKLMSELQRLKGKGRAGPPRVIAAALPAKSQKPLYIYTAFGILFYRNLRLSCFHHIWHKVKLASVCTQPPVE